MGKSKQGNLQSVLTSTSLLYSLIILLSLPLVARDVESSESKVALPVLAQVMEPAESKPPPPLLAQNVEFAEIKPLQIAVAQVEPTGIKPRSTALAQGVDSTQNKPPAPPTDVRATDTPNDDGSGLTVTWTKSADDGGGDNDVIGYRVLRSEALDGLYEIVASTIAGEEQYVDSVRTGVTYYYKVTANDGKLTSDSEVTLPTVATAQWFHRGRTSMFVLLIVFSGFVLWCISRARRGEELYIRPIAGLQALDEAVGRATEMGKPVLFVPGVLDMDQIETIAGLSVLGRVAGKTAEYGAPLLVPTRHPLVMTAARETVREAYLGVGRPDAYEEDKIWYLTSEQFGYAAGVDGIMIREKPGAIFYMGAFYAESLVLAETGHQTGAIQVAGTARPAQLPFFVTACDYTLIGEELFAASAYLSKQSTSLGSLKGQDYGKAVFMGLIVLGAILASFGIPWLVRVLTVG